MPATDIVVYTGTAPTNWSLLDLSGVVGKRRAAVMLNISNGSDNMVSYTFRMPGSDWSVGDYPTSYGANVCVVPSGESCTAWVTTDDIGRSEWIASDGASDQVLSVYAWLS